MKTREELLQLKEDILEGKDILFIYSNYIEPLR